MGADVPALRRLWQEAFGDGEETLDAFFTTGFSRERYGCICENGVPVSALYWFDCALHGQKLAYIYAVATLKTHRGKGFAQRLMTQTHCVLKEKGYAGAILVPGEESLFAFYEKLGYRSVSSVKAFSCTWADAPVPLRELDAAEFARLRRQYLPAHGVVQEGATLEFLQTQARFFAGEDFLLAAAKEKDTLAAQELLGNAEAAPGILRALGTPEGRFRTQGAGRAFAMLLPLQANCPVPAYFGLALD